MLLCLNYPKLRRGSMKQDSSEKILEWSEKIKQQKLSKLSEERCCQAQNISYYTFQYWKSKIHSKAKLPKKEKFIEIKEDLPWIEITARRQTHDLQRL